MPLVKRKIIIENENTCYSKDEFEHVLYVPPSKVKSTDTVAEPVSEAQLAELAAQYPEEYAAQAKAAGVEPASPGQLAQLLDMSSKALVAKIASMAVETDEEILWALYEAEISEDGEDGDGTGRRRGAILTALASKGVGEQE